MNEEMTGKWVRQMTGKWVRQMTGKWVRQMEYFCVTVNAITLIFTEIKNLVNLINIAK